ncbi:MULTISPECIES: hypothetical protein [Xanthomonas]|uniref:hypothetical protein n=1 Tax=Xanthomonas TaxID=338 RepID=UPI000AE9DBE1|nr:MULTISPECIES: hypothetical protein [Xanthomonas]MCW3193402.1 hypothetical protein [Xanthomonas citri pv. fuscans]QTH25278.1 hypothetical protein XcfCFBP6166P_23470 [Xanthomonas citri pv. phaseoli var. fuscans]QTH26093.1 hypothetical protein XcfCFBP7767P_24190 [Xanthomonas citri pv. phaseoli var. fuscans]QTZ97710.1 hypothetical protein XcfCFBP4885P_23170 [Xanthomonas citri pv. phaseoli var. fuscans]SON89008.1 hypothetical protein XFF6166_90017 [Xanthomonas citri pv. fuscans]
MAAKKNQASVALENALALSRSAATGKFVRLSDPELAPFLRSTSDKLASDKNAALEFLRGIGVSTPTGRLTKRYGG